MPARLPRRRWRWRAGFGALLAGAALATSAACSSAAARPRARAHAARLSGAACAANRKLGTLTFASPFGFDASAGILDVEAAIHLGYFTDECLKVTFVSSPASANPVALVSTGRATVSGEGSAADFLQAVASGNTNMVAVATYGDTSDYAILTKPSITSLKQLNHKTLGYHPALPVAIQEMLAVAGADKVQLVVDNSYNPLLLTEGHFDAIQAYQSNEPITLRAAHQAFREYVPSRYGVKGTFNVQVMNAAFVRQHRQAAADFLRAELHAFAYCAQHATACISGERQAAKAAGVDYNAAHSLTEWRFEAALAEHHHLAGKGIGVESYAEWMPEAKALVDFHIVKKVPALSSVEDPGLAASLYRGTKLIWPG